MQITRGEFVDIIKNAYEYGHGVGAWSMISDDEREAIIDSHAQDSRIVLVD